MDTRTKILKSALKAFARYGYDGVSTKNIADNADVSESTIFRVFGNKDKLMGETLTYAFAGFETPAPDPDKSFRENVEHVFVGLIDRFFRHPDRSMLFYRTAFSGSHGGHESTKALMTRLYAPVIALYGGDVYRVMFMFSLVHHCFLNFQLLKVTDFDGAVVTREEFTRAALRLLTAGFQDAPRAA